MTLLNVLRARTKPVCVIKPGGTHIYHFAPLKSMIIRTLLQNKQGTKLTFKSLKVHSRDHAR